MMRFTTVSIAQLQHVSHDTLTWAEKSAAWNKSINELTLAEARYLASVTRSSENVKLADNYQRDTKDWPDPTEPRASKPPAPKGCTCDLGLKLECPVHGMHREDIRDMDNQWTNQQEANPVGFPQDAPRTWQQAYSSVPLVRSVSGHIISEFQHTGLHNINVGSQQVPKFSFWEGQGIKKKLSYGIVDPGTESARGRNRLTFVSHSVSPLIKISNVSTNVRLSKLVVGDAESRHSANNIDWIPNPPVHIKRSVQHNHGEVRHAHRSVEDSIKHATHDSKVSKPRQASFLKTALTNLVRLNI